MRAFQPLLILLTLVPGMGDEIQAIKAGVMEDQLLDLAAIKALSSLPSKEVLLAQLLSTINGVPTSFVRVLNAVPQGFVNILSALKDQKAEA